MVRCKRSQWRKSYCRPLSGSLYMTLQKQNEKNLLRNCLPIGTAAQEGVALSPSEHLRRPPSKRSLSYTTPSNTTRRMSFAGRSVHSHGWRSIFRYRKISEDAFWKKKQAWGCVEIAFCPTTENR